MQDDATKTYVTVGAKRTLEYVYEVLSRLTLGCPEVTLRGVGQAISKCAETSAILSDDLGCVISDTRLVNYARKDKIYNAIEITMSLPIDASLHGYEHTDDDDFIDFSIYHLLLTAYLHTSKTVTVSIENYLSRNRADPVAPKGRSQPRRRQPDLPVLTIKADHYDYAISVAHGLTQESVDKHDRAKILENIGSAFGRAGILLSHSWEHVSSVFCQDDDVIIGVDTNILENCAITQQLLDGFLVNNCRGHGNGPNWVLLIIPNGVMHEIEQIANNREGGLLTHIGRIGYRALAEILEIDQSKDLTGISLLVVGEADPVLDARVELRNLRQDMKGEIHLKKLSTGDTHIRDQFKQFLRQISFHKGTYFLTADKSNSALAQAEGLRSQYFAPIHPRAIQLADMRVSAPHLMETFPSNGAAADPVRLTVPLGKIIFELVVQFGHVWLEADGKSVLVEGDVVGESLVNWVEKRLKIGHEDFKRLVDNYEKIARFPLAPAVAVWQALNQDMMDRI